MNPTNSFLECFVNSEHRLLGKRLKPLCLRHLIHLHAINSPFVETGKTITLQDVEVAAVICSSEPLDSLENIFDVKRLSWWQRFKLGRWKKANVKADLKAEIYKFLAYQDDYVAVPATGQSGKENSNQALPYLLMHAAALIVCTGWAEEDVLNMPLGKVIQLNLAFSYIKSGETNVISDTEQEAIDALKALQEGV